MKLEKLPLNELKKLAEDNNVIGWDGLNRYQLIKALEMVLGINDTENKSDKKKEILYLSTSRILYKGERYTREQLLKDQETARILYYENGLKSEFKIIFE